MSLPTKELMKLVLEKNIARRSLRSSLGDGHIYIMQDSAGNIKVDKEKSTEKIGGAVELITALDRALKLGGSDTASMYD